MIRRITPWPIEPPLQFWRWPMRAGFKSQPTIAITLTKQPMPLPRNRGLDISAIPIYSSTIESYLRAIKVYDMTYRRHRGHDDSCNVTFRIQIGSYDTTGAFNWRRHLDLFVDTYNHDRRLKTLKGLTPAQFIWKKWQEKPEIFYEEPCHLTSGLYRMRLFVGLDVSLAKTAICVVSEHGKIVNEAQVASEPEVLERWAREQEGTIAAIGLEAGPLSQWLHRGLSGAGLDVVLMETRQVKGALKAMPIKTDRRDAEGIARLLTLAGSGRFIANPCWHKRSEPCSGHAKPSSRE